MGYAEQLAEAVEALPSLEQKSFLDCLDEHVSTAMYTGHFTTEAMDSAWFVILREAGATEDDLDEVNEAIDEFLDEALTELRDETKAKALATAKKHGKKAAKSLGREVAKQAAGPLAKRVASIRTKSKTGKMLKHAAAGAIKQIGKDPSKAKKILKKSAARAGKKLVKAGVKKGLKMVFGRWVKSKKEEIEALDERKRSSKRAEVEKAFAKRGTIRMPRINPREYPAKPGLEGPFQFRDGRILYYDQREGRYYDSKTDMYLARNDIPEDQQELLAALMEADGFGPFDLAEAIAPKSFIPILSRAADVELDPKVGKKLAQEFVVAMRDHIAEEWPGNVFVDVEPLNSKTVKTSDEDPEYGMNVDIEYEMPTKVESYDTFTLGIPQIVDRMSSARRFLGHNGAINLKRNLARALMSDLKLAKRLIGQAAQSSIRSWSAVMTDDIHKGTGLGDIFIEMVEETLDVSTPRGIPSEYVQASRWNPLASFGDFGTLSLTLKRLTAEPVRSSKFVKSPGGEDIPMEVKSIWDVRGEVEVEVNWDVFYDAGERAGRDSRKYGSRWSDVFG